MFIFKANKSLRWNKLLCFIGFTSILMLCGSACQSNFDKRFYREAKEYTKNNCPMSVEEGTLLDSISYNQVSRVYTLYYSVNCENEAVMKANTPLLHYNLLQLLMNNTDYKEVKDNGVTFEYIYRSERTHKMFYTTQIRKEEYQGTK